MDLADLFQSTNDIELNLPSEKPKSTNEKLSKSNPSQNMKCFCICIIGVVLDFSSRLAFFATRGNKVPQANFPPTELGRGFKLDDQKFRTVSDFNGYWKMLSGGNELFRGQTFHPERKKKLQLGFFDGPVRFLLVAESY